MTVCFTVSSTFSCCILYVQSYSLSFISVLTESNEWVIINITDPFKPLQKLDKVNTNQKCIHYLEHCEAMNCMTTSSCTLDVKGKVHQSKCPLGACERLDVTQTVIWLVLPLKGPGALSRCPPALRCTAGVHMGPTGIPASIWKCLLVRRREA